MRRMLEEIMKEVERAGGPLTVKELSDRVGVEQSALEGMLDFLERKGRLSVYRPGEDSPECDAVSCVECVFRSSCPSKSSDEKGGA